MRSETIRGYGVLISNGTKHRLALYGLNELRFVRLKHRDAVEFKNKLLGHLPNKQLKVVRVDVTYEFE